MRKYFVISRWWDTVMGWWLFLRRRPRCANSPFTPAPQTGQPATAKHQTPD